MFKPMAKNLDNILKEFNDPKNKEKYRPLTIDEERELICKLRETNLEELKQQLINHNVFIPINLSKGYINNSKDYEGVLQDAFWGLCYAMEKFDFDRQQRFCTYAYNWIKKYALMDYYDKHNMHITKNSNPLNAEIAYNTSGGDDDNAEYMDVFDPMLEVATCKDFTYFTASSLSASDVVESNEVKSAITNIYENLLSYINISTEFTTLDKDIFKLMLVDKKSAKDVSSELDIKQNIIQYKKTCILNKLKKFLEKNCNIHTMDEIK